MNNDFKLLTDLFVETQSGVTERIKNAEIELNQLSEEPNFYLLLLQYIESNNIDQVYRQLATLYFKNFTIKNWYEEDEDGDILPSKIFNEDDQNKIRKNLVNLTLTTPRLIQNQLLEVVKKIAEIDFYENWPDLMTQLTSKLDTDNFDVINAIFSIMNMIFKNYRYYTCSDELLIEVDYVLKAIQETLVKMLEELTNFFDNIKQSNDPNKQSQYFRSLKLVSKIFYSLSCHQLPAYFDTHLDSFCLMFEKFLEYDNGQFKSQESEVATELEKLQTAICKNINLLTTKYSEDFNKKVTTFLQSVWKLLLRLDLKTRYDKLVIEGINFLTSVSRGEHRDLFGEADTLKDICENIVIPNLYFREISEDIFEAEPEEYIRQDIEGSNENTRRSASTELVRSLNNYHEKAVTEIFSEYVFLMLEEYQKNKTENWKSKDAAIYLVIALTVKTKTQASGATSASSLIDITSFYQDHILPEITNNDSHPVLKTDSLKYVLTFRTLLEKNIISDLMGTLVTLLESQSYVINTYSAVLIERILAIRELENRKPRFNKDDIKNGLEILLTNLFAIFAFEDEELNDYVMKAIMRVTAVSKDYVIEVSEPIIGRLSEIVLSICKNPTKPHFNHYVFETFASIIRTFNYYKADLTIIENQFLPIAKTITELENQDLAPYVYQILAQLLEGRTQKDFEQSNELKEFYFEFLLPKVLDQESWKSKGNIPALTLMFQAYISVIPNLLVENGYLENILNYFLQMVPRRVHENDAFKILDSIYLHIDVQSYQSYLPDIFKGIFDRLNLRQTDKFIRLFNVWLSKIIGKHGVILVIEAIDSIQKNLFSNILSSIYLKNINKIQYPIHKKAILVSLLRMLTDSNVMINDVYSKIWPLILTEIIKILENVREQLPKNNIDDNNFEIKEDISFSTEFSKLMFTHKRTKDFFPEFTEPKNSFIDLITNFIKNNNGFNFLQLIQNQCPEQYDDIINYLNNLQISFN
ncbi:exportin-2 [Anaeramoeba flamelloides]|uniref:Exportin-2 n=1 Tax=Anaeramoeba flamelloides TaxID=1746091 RepID=A0AAV8A048_9EUKA|nr:exportin-2 [Anaeramoeba flamelloides]